MKKPEKFSSTGEITKDTIALMILLFVMIPVMVSVWEHFKIFGVVCFFLISYLLNRKVSFIRTRLGSLTYRIIDARRIFYGLIGLAISLVIIDNVLMVLGFAIVDSYTRKLEGILAVFLAIIFYILFSLIEFFFIEFFYKKRYKK